MTTFLDISSFLHFQFDLQKLKIEGKIECNSIDLNEKGKGHTYIFPCGWKSEFSQQIEIPRKRKEREKKKKKMK